MNKKDFYKNYYSDFKMSENEKRMILNDLHSELSSGTKPLYSKLKFKAAVSVALSVCIISSALTYSQYSDRHNVPVQTENTNPVVTEQSSSETDVINSDTITVTISTDVPQNSETYKTTESFNDYTEISESLISDTEKSSSEAETNVTNTDSTVSESHTSREPDVITEPTATDSETIVPVTTSKRITDGEDTTNDETDDVTNHPVTTTGDTVKETREYPETTTAIVTTVGAVTTTAAEITTAPEETTTEETTTTTSETTVPVYETEADASQPPEENY